MPSEVDLESLEAYLMDRVNHPAVLGGELALELLTAVRMATGLEAARAENAALVAEKIQGVAYIARLKAELADAKSELIAHTKTIKAMGEECDRLKTSIMLCSGSCHSVFETRSDQTG